MGTGEDVFAGPWLTVGSEMDIDGTRYEVLRAPGDREEPFISKTRGQRGRPMADPMADLARIAADHTPTDDELDEIEVRLRMQADPRPVSRRRGPLETLLDTIDDALAEHALAVSVQNRLREARDAFVSAAKEIPVVEVGGRVVVEGTVYEVHREPGDDATPFLSAVGEVFDMVEEDGDGE